MYDEVEQLRLLVPMSDHEVVLRDRFAAVDARTAEVAIAFGAIESDGLRFRRVQVSPALADEFRAMVAETVEDWRKRLDDGGVQVRPYNAGAKLDDHQLERLTRSGHEEIFEQLEPLASPDRLEPFEGDADFASGPGILAIGLRLDGGSWLHCLRVLTEGARPQRRKLAMIKGHGKDYYDTLSEPFYLLDRRGLDCLSRDDDLIVVKKERFEQIFRLYDEARARQAAERLLDAVAVRLPFANGDAFAEACRRDRRMAEKVARFRGQPFLDRLSVARAKLAKERYDLDIEFETRDGVEMLKFVAKHKWQYVSLLGDEYLTSLVTGLDYEANSKRPIAANGSGRAARRRTA